MAAKDFQLVLAAAAKRLSDVYIGTVAPDGTQIGGSVGVPDGRTDIPYRQLILSAEGAAAFVGAASDVSSTNYGTRVEIGAAGSEAISIGPFSTGPVKLSDFWVAGAGATLHVLGIPY